jgi:hypothetical protein
MSKVEMLYRVDVVVDIALRVVVVALCLCCALCFVCSRVCVVDVMKRMSTPSVAQLVERLTVVVDAVLGILRNQLVTSSILVVRTSLLLFLFMVHVLYTPLRHCSTILPVSYRDHVIYSCFHFTEEEVKTPIQNQTLQIRIDIKTYFLAHNTNFEK